VKSWNREGIPDADCSWRGLLVVNSSMLVVFVEPSVFHIIAILVHFGLGLMVAGIGLVEMRRWWRELSRPGRLGGSAVLVSSGIGTGMACFGRAAVVWVRTGGEVDGAIARGGRSARVDPRDELDTSAKSQADSFARDFAVVVDIGIGLTVGVLQYRKRSCAGQDRDRLIPLPPLDDGGGGSGASGTVFRSFGFDKYRGTIPANFFMNSNPVRVATRRYTISGTPSSPLCLVQ
jgi:hypothetical protein